MTTYHIGFGTFRLEDLLPDETFARFNGSLAKVCRLQPQRTRSPTPDHLFLPDLIQVWTDLGTSNAMRVFLHRTARAHAISPEQARAIEARLRQQLTHRGGSDEHS